MTTNSSSYELEHELRYRLPKSVFVNLLTSPYKPFTIVDRVIIRQLWTYNDGVSRSRIRELVDNSGNTTYTACTKYKLDKDNQIEFERPILPAEFASVRSLYPNTRPSTSLSTFERHQTKPLSRLNVRGTHS